MPPSNEGEEKGSTMKEAQIKWPRVSGGKALTAETEKGILRRGSLQRVALAEWLEPRLVKHLQHPPFL